MGNDNKSCSDGTCSTGTCNTGKCGKMMMPMMIIIMLLVLGGLFIYFNNSGTVEQAVEQNIQETLAENTNSESTENTNSQIENISVKSENGYKEYSSNLLVADKTNILFFVATWCPACQAADKNFSVESIPSNINLLKVDYDKYSDLKEKYGITMQHTYVQVDQDGNEIKKWSGSTNVSDLLNEI